ncbi:MAG: adenylyltransferase/cytidyltransferase family protein [Patescibacteria group bacterium]
MKTVYTYGVFDLFHAGHVALLKEARALGDKLIVGLFTDEVAESFKRRPVIDLENRKQVLQSCRFVDEVVVQEKKEPDETLLKLQPDILAKGPGAGWGEGSTTIPGAATMKQLGKEVVALSYHPGISTSEIIKKIKS